MEHLICKHPLETLQQEYDRLLNNLCDPCTKNIVLKRPIKFRATPHSNEVVFTTLIPGVDIENYYGQAKFAVLQTLRLLNSNNF